MKICSGWYCRKFFGAHFKKKGIRQRQGDGRGGQGHGVRDDGFFFYFLFFIFYFLFFIFYFIFYFFYWRKVHHRNGRASREERGLPAIFEGSDRYRWLIITTRIKRKIGKKKKKKITSEDRFQKTKQGLKGERERGK